MGVLCFHQVFDLLLLCTKCIPCAVALLLHTGVENECRMAEGVAVLLTQHQRVVVERQDQRGVMVDGGSSAAQCSASSRERICPFSGFVAFTRAVKESKRAKKGWRKFA